MPNHVTSICKVTGPESEVARFIEKCISSKKGRSFLDFGSIIPMPESVNNAPSKSPLTPEEAEICMKAKVETGYSNWYDWSIARWGTKWNSYDYEERTRALGEFSFKFETAWSFPEPVFMTLTDMFPTLEFDVVCFDEGHYFAGKGKFTSSMFRCSRALVTPELYRQVYGVEMESDEE